MGLFDVRCALTGVAINNGECALVILREHAGRVVPASLPLWGSYSGYGSLDDVLEDQAADALLRGLDTLMAKKRLAVNERLARLPERFRDPEILLALLTDGGAQLSCDGHLLRYAVVLGAAAKIVMQRAEPVDLARVCDLEPERSSYVPRAHFREEYHALGMLDAAVQRAGGWTFDAGQYTDRDVRRFYSASRERHRGDSAMMKVLSEYGEWRFDGSDDVE